jgi:hypothetical protein
MPFGLSTILKVKIMHLKNPIVVTFTKLVDKITKIFMK